MLKFEFRVCIAGVPLEDLPTIVSHFPYSDEATVFAQNLATGKGLLVRWNEDGSGVAHYVKPESKTCDAGKEAEYLMTLARRIEAWAYISEEGGWSTNHVATQRQTATELRAHAAQLLYP